MKQRCRLAADRLEERRAGEACRSLLRELLQGGRRRPHVAGGHRPEGCMVEVRPVRRNRELPLAESLPSRHATNPNREASSVECGWCGACCGNGQ
jgi:hypothetical protein